MHQLLRVFQIVSVIARFRLDNLFSMPAGRRSKILWLLLPWRFLKDRRPRGVRLREALTILGPVFVKFGQQLSTRRDLLPDDINAELTRLQDKVPPFDSQLAFAIIEKELGKPASELFESVEPGPIAAASVAQVYGAVLHSGERVVIKVIRPGIEQVIRRDIKLMYFIARLSLLFFRDSRRFRPKEVIDHFQKTILDELDLQREAANASQLRRNFDNSPIIYVPKIYWSLCASKILVMERIYGIPVSEVALLKKRKVNLKKLAEQGVEVFFTQVFRDSFFHADMHPGNVFVCTENPENPRYIAVDFGIVGTLAPEDQSYLARNLLAFFKRDYFMVAKLHIDSGWVDRDTPVNELAGVIRTVCEPIFERPFGEISFAHVLLELFRIAGIHGMTVQPQLVLLQKTLLNIEGLGKQLYPELDLWSTAQPFLEKWMRKRVSPLRALYRAHLHMPHVLEQTPVLLENALRDIHYAQRSRALKRRRADTTVRPLAVISLPRIAGGCILALSWLSYSNPGWLNADAAMVVIPGLLGGGLLFLSAKPSD